jgi:hypothetical protein
MPCRKFRGDPLGNRALSSSVRRVLNHEAESARGKKTRKSRPNLRYGARFARRSGRGRVNRLLTNLEVMDILMLKNICIKAR